MRYRHLPVVSGQVSDRDADAVAALLAEPVILPHSSHLPDQLSGQVFLTQYDALCALAPAASRRAAQAPRVPSAAV